MPWSRTRSTRALRRRVQSSVCALLLLACGDGIEERLERAETAQASGDFATSIEVLQEVIDRSPHDPRANYLLGQAYVRTNQPSLAVWPLREAATSESELAPQAGLLLASTLLAMEGFEEAVAAADLVIARDPEHTHARLLRARGLLRAGKFEPALAGAADVLAVEEGGRLGFGARQIQGEALVELDRVDEAEHSVEAMYALAQELELPDAPLTCVVVSSFRLEALEDAEAAEAQLAQCLADYPEVPSVLNHAVWFYDRHERPEEATQLLRDAVARAPDDFTVLPVLAERLRASGEAEEAEALLREAAELSEQAVGWLTLAGFYRRGGDNAKVLEAIDQAVAASGSADADGAVLFQRADLLVSAGRSEEALELVASLRHPAHKALIRGRVLQERGANAEALAAYEEGVALWPNNAGARYQAGRSAEAIGDLERAKSHYREATRASAEATDAALELARIALDEGRYASAYELVTRHGRARPVTPELYYLGGMAALKLERFGEADASFALLEKSDPRNGLLGRARVARARGGHAAAAALLAAAELDLTDAENEALFHALLMDLIRAERHSEAVALAERARSARPEVPSVHDLYGRALVEAGRRDAGAESFERALALDPGYGPAIAAQGTLAGTAGQLAEAIALYDRAAAAETPDPEAAYLAAQLASALGDHADAERRLRAVLAAEPYHARAANDLAWLLAQEERELDEALRLAQLAVRIDAIHEAYDTLGTVLMKQHEPVRASDAFAKAIEKQPSSPTYHYQRGVALASAGRDEAAGEAFRAAIERGPFPQQEAARAELARLEGSGEAIP